MQISIASVAFWSNHSANCERRSCPFCGISLRFDPYEGKSWDCDLPYGCAQSESVKIPRQTGWPWGKSSCFWENVGNFWNLLRKSWELLGKCGELLRLSISFFLAFFFSLSLSIYILPLSVSLSLSSDPFLSSFLYFSSLSICLCLSLYIYICCRVKTWSKNSLFLSQNLVQVFFFKNPLLSAVRMTFFRKTRKKRKTKKKKKHIFWVKTWSNFVAQHTWTRFWLNLGPDFDSTLFVILGYFYLF